MEPRADSATIISTLPKSWEDEETFHDVLYEWMERAPWLLLSGALHFVLFLVIAAIPWSVFEPADEQTIIAELEAPPEPDPIEELPEEPDEIETEEVMDEPVIEDFTSTESLEDSNDTALSDSVSPTPSPNPFDHTGENGVLGIGGGADGGRGLGGGPPRSGGTKQTNVAVDKGLAWLARHQDVDGRWNADDFMLHDPESDRTTGAGDPNHDVGLTGFALLAFLGDGHTLKRGKYRDTVTRGAKFLSQSQDRETGLIGHAIGHGYIYDHILATLALCEIVRLDRSVHLRQRAQKASHYLSRHRQPYGVWGYQPPPFGDTDTSVTGWALFAMKAAQDCGLEVDHEAFTATLLWFDEMTEEATGRVGYTERGSRSSRVLGVNDQFAPERGEALTAVGLLGRFFLGQTPDDSPIMTKQADLLLRTPPRWNPEAGDCDMYYWYYGSYAMFQMGGRHWKEWNRAMKSAVIDSQRADGSSMGSWDPAGPWGPQGGRVYSTAAMVLCMEVYYRYARLTGTR
ncbi:hypothetical protein Poly30_15230 [Planctomycetes bacterium Poly30]|uniref:Squalene cyclase C-terminal domain-containing protein n=1 Tax=Saltatorellus ferox TaxID=2528018 RepID=A0A518EPK5_9BACT|nr:hypothetical protein Poly30_15230 [Planctomycetes bacterium Poly30]